MHDKARISYEIQTIEIEYEYVLPLQLIQTVGILLTICACLFRGTFSLRWRHNDHAGVSNHQPHGCLLNRVFRRKSKKTSKLRVTGLCVGNSPGTGEFPAQMASYAENVSIWCRHHVKAQHSRLNWFRWYNGGIHFCLNLHWLRAWWYNPMKSFLALLTLFIRSWHWNAFRDILKYFSTGFGEEDPSFIPKGQWWG